MFRKFLTMLTMFVILFSAVPVMAQHRGAVSRPSVSRSVGGYQTGRAILVPRREPIRMVPYRERLLPFRPLGWGLYLQYPVVLYPYGYASDYSTPYVLSPYVIGTQPVQTGGLGFDLTPSNATVVVDGIPEGSVSLFPVARPLVLAPGQHQVTISALGYQSAQFSITIVAGQVQPIVGVLNR